MKIFIKLISAILALFIFSPSGDVTAYSPIDKDNLKTSFTVISDGHLESNNSQKHKNYGEFFCDTASNEVMSKTLVMLGDNTMNGQLIEMSMLYGLLNKYNKIENVLNVAGNHDVCDGDYNSNDYETLKERFIKYNNAFLDNRIEKLYYSRVIDGYHYIVLGTDADVDIQEYFSEEQLAWLDGELKSAAENGNPVFLFNHWPLNDVFSDAWQEGHIGEQSEELKNILTKYDNRIFFFTGHLHMGVFDNGYGIKEDGNITYINVPSFGSVNDIVESDVQNTGMGLQVEVYEKEIVVRVRNFVEHQWTDYEYHFSY